MGYQRAGHYNLSAGRPLLAIQVSRDHKTSEQMTVFFFCRTCGDIFYYFFNDWDSKDVNYLWTISFEENAVNSHWNVP